MLLIDNPLRAFKYSLPVRFWGYRDSDIGALLGFFVIYLRSRNAKV